MVSSKMSHSTKLLSLSTPHEKATVFPAAEERNGSIKRGKLERTINKWIFTYKPDRNNNKRTEQLFFSFEEADQLASTGLLLPGHLRTAPVAVNEGDGRSRQKYQQQYMLSKRRDENLKTYEPPKLVESPKKEVMSLSDGPCSIVSPEVGDVYATFSQHTIIKYIEAVEKEEMSLSDVALTY